jgi:hypothetical protein
MIIELQFTNIMKKIIFDNKNIRKILKSFHSVTKDCTV